MGQAVAIVLPDAQATPVNHTFTPVGSQKDGYFYFEDQSASSPIGFNRIGIRNRRVTQGNARNASESTTRIDIVIKTPKLETLGTNSAGFTPPPTVAFVPMLDVSFAISDRSAALDRKDLRKYLTGLLANSQIVSLIEDQIPIW